MFFIIVTHRWKRYGYFIVNKNMRVQLFSNYTGDASTYRECIQKCKKVFKIKKHIVNLDLVDRYLFGHETIVATFLLRNPEDAKIQP